MKLFTVIMALIFMPLSALPQTAAEARNPAYWNQHRERRNEISAPTYWWQNSDQKPIPGQPISPNSPLLDRVNHCEKLSSDVGVVAEVASHRIFEKSVWTGGRVPHGEVRFYQSEILAVANSLIRDNRYRRADGGDAESCQKNAAEAIREIKMLVREALGRSY
ncbi:exported hypothetical protein [Candidatus Terasakiella magnetica]|nr:exported hypothetical protein [Candidatus Terasakiella magnetica]